MFLLANKHMRGLLTSTIRGASSPSEAFRELHKSTTTAERHLQNLGTSKGLCKPDDSIRPIDHGYISQILDRRDWFLLLGHEFRAKRISLKPQFVVSVLQNQENPLHPLRFYLWVLSKDPKFDRNGSAKRVLGSVLFRRGPVLLSADLVEDVRISGACFTEELLCVMFGSWGRLGLAKYCGEVFGQLSFLGFVPSTRLYNAVIDALVRANALDMAYLKFHQMTADNCKPDRFTYNILVYGVCKAGLVDEALRLVKQMEGVGCVPNVYTYTILIDGFCNAKMVEKAFKVVDEMREKKLSPSEATVRALIHGVFQCMDDREAFERLLSFSEGKHFLRNVAYDTMLYCLSKKSMVKEAAFLLTNACEKGYVPDREVFNMAIVCLIKGVDIGLVVVLLEQFATHGLNPAFNTYLTLLRALYEAGETMQGDKYLKMMTEQGLVSNVFSYNMVIDCFCQTNMPVRARLILDEMQDEGIKPNLVTFNTLIGGYCRVGDICKAKEMLQMLFSFRIRPDVVTFTTLIDALCRINQPENALNCLTEMGEWGITPNAITYNVLLRALCTSGNIGKSMEILRKMQRGGFSPDISSFNTLIHTYCRVKILDKAMKLLHSMLVLGLAPDKTACNILLEALNESGKFADAEKISLLLEVKKILPCSSTANLRMNLDLLYHAASGRFRTGRWCWTRSDHYKSLVLLQRQICREISGNKAFSSIRILHIYHSCEGSYRLDQSGELHVPPEYVNEYCEGPCQEETGLVLKCLHHIFANFIFYNKATITVIKDTIHEACSFGPERGNFNVAEHLQADSAVSTDFAYQIVFSLTSILVGLMFIL